MGRLKDKLYTSVEQEQQPEYCEQPPQEEYEPTEEEVAEYYQQQLEERQQQQQQQYIAEEVQRKEDAQKSPLAILDEIKLNPSPKGTLPVLIGGRPIDLHILEDYIVKISPHALKTILRYHNARTIEEIKNYSRGPILKIKSGFWFLIIGLIAICVLGVVVLMFAPQLTAMFKNFAP